MSTKVKFGNKLIQLPGTYSRIIAAQNNPPSNLDYGKLLIIDNNDLNSTVTGNGILGGAGINGELAKGKNAVYSIKTGIQEFLDFVGAGWWNKAAEGLFNPDGNNNGVSEVLIVKPTTTLASVLTFSPTGGGTAGGTFKVKTKDEGVAANGVITDGRPTLTFAASTTVDPVIGESITLKIGTTTVATFTHATTVKADMIAGLAASMTSIGICEVISSTSPNLVFKPTVGSTVTVNASGSTSPGTISLIVPSATPLNLLSGYAYTVTTGVVDKTKWIYKIWKGTYKGLYSDGLPYDEVSSANAKPALVAQSPEFNNVQTLIDWAKTDSAFGKLFVLDPTSTKVGTGLINSADVLAASGYKASTGGTTTWDSLDAVLDIIKDYNYNAILTTCSTADPSIDADILKIIDHIENEAKFDKHLYIAGDGTDPDTSVGYAQTINSEKVILVHGSIKKVSQLAADGFRSWEPFFHTTYNVGRVLGLAPEVPLTNKSLNIDGLVAPLTHNDQVKLDGAGVLCTIFDEDFGQFVNLHDVNTLQDSEFVLTNDGKSHLIQVERIKSQLDKELIINAKKDLFSDPNGVNRFSLTEEDAIEWTKGYLGRKLGTLLVAWRNVTATTVGDFIFVNYEASPNSEIKGMFFTGGLYL